MAMQDHSQQVGLINVHDGYLTILLAGVLLALIIWKVLSHWKGSPEGRFLKKPNG